MAEKGKVDETAMGEYETLLQTVGTAISNLDDYHKELDEILASGKWDGDAHSVCVSVVAGVYDYLQNMIENYKTLKEDIEKLVTDVDLFVNVSPSVKNISE